MSGYLFPRLSKGNAQLWTDRFSGSRPVEIAEQLPLKSLEGIRYAPTGGSRVPQDILAQFRVDLTERATACGYPDQRSNAAQREFDLSAARLLIELPMIMGEALRDEVWQYFTCFLVPDLVAWRFGKTSGGTVRGPTSSVRFMGGTRNVLQRMWWRAIILRDPSAQDGLWLLDTEGKGLTEDNMVALLERANIAWYHDLCRAIAVAFIGHRPYVRECGDSPEETLLREVMKKVVRLAAHANLEAIPEEHRLELVRGLLVETVGEMGGEAPAPGRVYSRIAVQHLRDEDIDESGTHQLSAGDQMTALLGTKPKILACRLKWYWEDGTVRADTEVTMRWARVAAPEEGEGHWCLSLERAAYLEGVREGEILIIAERARDEGSEFFLLPQQGRMTLRILGALRSRGEGVEVPIEVEEYVRAELFARL